MSPFILQQLYVSGRSDVCVERGAEPHPHLHLHCPGSHWKATCFPASVRSAGESQELLLSLKYSTLAAGAIPLAKEAKAHGVRLLIPINCVSKHSLLKKFFTPVGD